MPTSRSQKLAIAFFASLAIMLMSVGAAAAAERHASPAGAGSACTVGSPCQITTAINSADSGDEVIIGAGTYGSSAAPVMDIRAVQNYVTIRGESPFARPTIYASNGAGNSAAFDPGQYATVSDLNIVSVATANTFYGFRSLFGSVNRVAVSGTAQDAICGIYSEASNTSCSAPTGTISAIEVIVGGSGSGPVQTRAFNWVNVNGVSQNGAGLFVISNTGIDLDIAVANSIFSGPIDDITLWSDHVNSADADIDIWSSNFSDVDLHGASVSVTASSSANNQTAEPQFLNAAGADLRPAATSPTVNAGDDSSVVGAQDAGGNARIFGGRVDIGAYEWSPAPPVDPGATPPIVKAPTLGKVKFSKKKFKAAGKGAGIQPAANAKKKSSKGFGSTTSFTSVGTGTVHFTLFKVTKKQGKTTYKKIKGVESADVISGNNKFWFSGRWNKKKLTPGNYQLRGTPTVKGNTIKTTKGDEPGTVRGPTSTVVK